MSHGPLPNCDWCGETVGDHRWWAKVPGAGAFDCPGNLCDPCHELWLSGETRRMDEEDWHQCAAGDFARGTPAGCRPCRLNARGIEMLGVSGQVREEWKGQPDGKWIELGKRR